MDRDERRRACAMNLAAWHDSSVRALGWRPTTTRSWWTCPTPAPNIYHSAISLRPADDDSDRDQMLDELQRHIDDPDSAYVSICDSWDELSLHSLGRDHRASGPWCERPAVLDPALLDPALLAPAEGGAAIARAVPTGVTAIDVVRTPDELATFEQTVVRGFGARPPVAAFDIHAPGILDDPAMTCLLGRDTGGRAVTVAMTCLTDSVLGIYGVATIPDARREGHATAITRRALEVAPDRLAMLQPSAEALPIYRRLGFTDLGWFSHWT